MIKRLSIFLSSLPIFLAFASLAYAYTPDFNLTALDLNAGTFTIDPSSLPSNPNYACQYVELKNVNTQNIYDLSVTNCLPANLQATTIFTPISIPDGSYILQFRNGVNPTPSLIVSQAFNLSGGVMTTSTSTPIISFNLTALDLNAGTFTIDPSSLPSNFGYGCQIVKLKNVNTQSTFGLNDYITNCLPAYLQSTTYFNPVSLPDGTYELIFTSAPEIMVSQDFILSGGVLTTNHAPSVGAITTSVNPVQVNISTSASVSFTDADTADTHTAVWNWGDGNTTTGTVTESNGLGSVSDSHTYTTAGVYTITLTVTDNHGASGTATYQYLAVYAPTSSGLFTGVRFFDNPTSAAPNTTGQVKFGISVKYNTSNQPTGHVSMNFKNANLDFTATSFDYLVTSGTKAFVKGSGTLNGNSGYTFLASGVDGHDTGGTDEIRFQIKQGTTTIYDTQPNAGDDADPTTSVTGQVIVH